MTKEFNKSSLVQEINHDLRTPLTSLSVICEMLKAHHSQIDEQERLELFQMLDADVRYLSDLVERMSTLNLVNLPLNDSTNEPMDLEALVRSELRRRRHLNKKLEWKLSCDILEPATIKGDPHLITRFLKNALDNAEKFTRTSIEVHLQVKNNKVEITIQDDGPGLPPHELRYFGCKRQRRPRKVNNFENFSFGLGSVIMKKIVEAHAANLSINNCYAGEKIIGAQLKVSFSKAVGLSHN